MVSTLRLIGGALVSTTWRRSRSAQKVTSGRKWARSAVLMTCLLASNLLRPASAQAPAPWGGWVQCRFDVQGTGYAHQEVQTWTITGPVSPERTDVQVYPAT